MNYPIPAREAERIDALKRLEILDSQPEQAFDRITRVAASILGTPIAVVSLVDETRQWFKSRHGLDAAETPREVAFCAHTIMTEDLMVVPDATADPRFADNPLVTDGLNIRFYAGAPLKSREGFNLGTLCAIDMKPREISEEERACLTDLAHLVVDEMELRLAGQIALREIAAREQAQNELEKINQELEGRVFRRTKELAEAKDRAEVANDAKTEFLANMSHELRTPLNAILGLTEMIGSRIYGPIGNDQYENFVDTINGSALHLFNVISDVLDVSAVESGKIKLDEQVVDVGAVINEVEKIEIPHADQYGVTLTVEIEDVLPTLHADRTRVKQIFLNLVNNAVKFSNPGTTVVLAATLDDDKSIVFSVSDKGIGIADKDISKVLETFGQVELATRRAHTGAGLGLPLSKTLVELHGGSLQIRSRLGEGTTVAAVFPAERTRT